MLAYIPSNLNQTGLAITVSDQIDTSAPKNKGAESLRAPESPSELAEAPKGATAVIVLGDGTIIWGRGIGAAGSSVGEVCFNTSMTGYQEILTDPSYAGQIITFTFPHIGNVGTNPEDIETIPVEAVPVSDRKPQVFCHRAITDDPVGVVPTKGQRVV